MAKAETIKSYTRRLAPTVAAAGPERLESDLNWLTFA